MSGKITNILMVGVGGQGTLLASEILSEVLKEAGFDVKKSEIHACPSEAAVSFPMCASVMKSIHR